MPRATKLQQGKNGKLASKRSKTQDPKCSAAASLFARGQAGPDTYKILGECRSKARMAGQAKLQREAGNEAKAQVLEKRAERGLTIKDRVARAKELIAQRKAGGTAKVAPATQAKPSLREQADAARAAKGDRNQRIEAVKSRMQSKYTAAKKADAKIGDKMTSLHKQVGRAKSEGKDTAPLVSQMQALNDASRSASKTRQNLESRAARVARIQSAAKPTTMAVQPKTGPSLLEQARAARSAKGDRTTRLKSLADKSMSIAMNRATKAGSLTGAAHERMVDRSMAATQRYNNLDAARTPFTPNTPAVKPPPAPVSGPPAERPKLSLLEQARIKRAEKNADRNRDGRLAARAKKQYDAARRNMKANLDKARALGPGTGEKYVEKATKYGKRLEVASKRYVKLHDMWATGGKFVQARVIDTPPAKAATPAPARPSLLEQVRQRRKAKGVDSPQIRAWQAAEKRAQLASFREGRAAAESDPKRYLGSTQRKMYLNQGNTAESALASIVSPSFAKPEDWIAAREIRARRAGIESGLRRAAKSPSVPSLLEQARKAREAKGTRADRIEAIRKKANKIAAPLIRKETDSEKVFSNYTRTLSRKQSEYDWASKNDKSYMNDLGTSIKIIRESISKVQAGSAKRRSRLAALKQRIAPLLAAR